LQHWPELHRQGLTWELLLRGKTIVGAMLGGWLMVELVKKLVGIQVSTGDRFIFPLLVGQAIGRLGCFLTGLEDKTYGTATALPWGMDFGDGLHRHPTQLYEIVFLILLGVGLRWRLRRGLASGMLFKLYFASYFAFRFWIDFLKPDPSLGLGLSAIQIACAIAVCFLLGPIFRNPSQPKSR
jgi:phosphatidylglycerol---prolipoprotein diacylglyceryl transferase